MQKLNIDFIIKLPTTIIDSKKVDAILVIIDRFTKISFFFLVNIIINVTKLDKIFYKEIKCK
jgi:hypothetical protein